MTSLLEDFLSKEENLWLEFKCCWKDAGENKIWGEFLKDFASLFNTYTETNDIKYLIIGFDESTKTCQNYYENNGKKLSIFKNKEKFKAKIIDKLKNHFRNIPAYSTSSELPSIETYFEIDIIKKEEFELLVFKLMPAPYLLELKKQLQGNETFRDGNIITRKLKSDNSPEIVNAASNEIDKLKQYTEKNKKEKFPENKITIEKIVTVFKDKNFPSATIKEIENLRNYNTGIFFEIYQIIGEYTPTIDFVYFSKHTHQFKSLEYIKENNLFDSSNTKIILIDEKNKDGGTIDKKRIERLFQKTYENIEIYYIEEFSAKKLYNDLIDEDIFYKESFNIKDFIQPMTKKSAEKTANLLLIEWYQNINEPLVVLKGIGGIGKTTVVKYFLDELYKKRKNDNLNILFINSHDLIHDIMKNPKIEDIFDFYHILAEKNHIEKKFNKKNLELSIDEGNVIIVLDGLDEVIAKIGSKFNVSKFIESIFVDYSDNMRKAKIIITCRDYFWDKNIEVNDNILTLDLEPFTKNMAEQYFYKHFKNQHKVDKAITLAEEFSTKDSENCTYIPYILDMIKEDSFPERSTNIIDSNILLKEGNLTDFIVGKVCEREIKKLGNPEIDKQLELCMDIAFEYDGVVDKIHLDKLTGRANINSEKFRAHPLLEYSIENEKLKFRYDFFNEYFKNIKLAIFLKDNEFTNLTKNMIDVLTQHISYDGSLMKDLTKRLEKLDFEELKLKTFTYIKEDLYKHSELNENLKNRVNSSLFTLLLVLGKYNNKESRTELLKEIYQENDKVEKLCLINLYTIANSKILFDFTDMTFEECHFENFENFTECQFNDNTFFSKCIFIAPLHKKGINTKLSEKNFDQSEKGQCKLEGIIDLLEERKSIDNNHESDLRNVLKKIFRLFWQGSTFRQKLKDEVRKKIKNYNNIIDLLLKHNIFEEVNVPTKQKRIDKAYRVNKKYSNLRKIMEENETCSEFEEIVQILKKNLYNKT